MQYVYACYDYCMELHSKVGGWSVGLDSPQGSKSKELEGLRRELRVNAVGY
jgi:hypothetical protein